MSTFLIQHDMYEYEPWRRPRLVRRFAHKMIPLDDEWVVIRNFPLLGRGLYIQRHPCWTSREIARRLYESGATIIVAQVNDRDERMVALSQAGGVRPLSGKWPGELIRQAFGSPGWMSSFFYLMEEK